MQGYYRYPSVHHEQVVFVSEDDLWSVPLKGGKATRLTSNLGAVSFPLLSPDGKWIAFSGREEGITEICVMPAGGGLARRLTWQGAYCWPVTWKGEKITYATMYSSFSMRELQLWEVDLKGNPPQKLNYGPARTISYGSKGCILGRNTSDPARWKRYRGGTAGYFLIDKDGKGNFKRFLDLKGNLSCPMWIGDRIWFLSDHEGIGNLYSVNLSGKDIRKHSQNTEYYARYAQSDGKTIVWQAGADLYSYDIVKDKVTRLKISYDSPFIQRNRKFVDTSKYLEDFALSPDAGYISMVVRGKAFAGGAWEGSIQQYGKKHDVHYRLATYLPREQGIVLVSDEGDKEHFEIHSLRKDFVSTNEVQEVKVFDQHDFGRPYSLEVSPCGKWIAFANHRNELMILNLESSELISIDQNKFGMIRSYNWSADSRWLAYVSSSNRLSTEVRIFGLEKKDIHTVSIPVKNDTEACFDPEGKYLYIMSERTFNPLHDELQYDITFHKTTKPYLITLREDIRSPFLPEPKALEPKPADEPKPGEKKDDADAKQIKPIKIDFEGITDRIVEFPVAADVMGGLYATTGKIFYYKFDPSAPREARNEAKADIYTFDLEKMEEQLFLSGVSGYVFNLDSSALIVLINKQLRILSAKRDPKAELPKETQAGRNTGWIDMSRIKTEIDPLSEWRQMFREAWRLQKYHFWTEDMSGIDWEKIFKRYYPLVERIGSRAEFSDLIWEMQGELGTSHCYEFGGDYKSPPIYRIGSLGVDWIFDAKKQQWKIGKIIKGDQWLGKNRSPLMNPGLNVPEGSVLLAINGIKLSAGQTPERTLVNYAGQPVQLTVCDSKGKDTRTITVNTMSQEFSARYRDWVEANRRYVHEKSHGKAGYIHIPDMGSEGIVEFHRYFLTELDHEALVVDVRYNGGGSVSQLILEKLARKRIGYDKTRWFGYEPYPSEAPAGALVCLTNEHAGSDGDIFSHAFKLMKLGKLVGKRTWGGVIGIWPRHWLVDGTITTQPEFSFWFKDVGWGVENYGTDPDIEVDILPQDYAASKDPQLDMAIKTVLEDLKKNPALKPDFSGRPNLGF